jgi:hypothetical protein
MGHPVEPGDDDRGARQPCPPTCDFFREWSQRLRGDSKYLSERENGRAEESRGRGSIRSLERYSAAFCGVFLVTGMAFGS